MATRHASQQLLSLRRIPGAPCVSQAAAAARSIVTMTATAAARPWTSTTTTTTSSNRRSGCEDVLGRRMWYSSSSSSSSSSSASSNEQFVPDSRIWKFDEIKKLVEEGQDPKNGGKVIIVDVREPSELLATGKIPGAVNIPITSAVQSFHVPDADFEDVHGFARPPRDAALLFYCKAGVRARAAAGLARHAGWASVGEYPGSWLEWETHQGPVEKVSRGRGGGGRRGGGDE